MSSTTDRVGRTRSSDPTTWPDEIGRQLPRLRARMGGRLVDAHLRFGDQCRLQRHPERVGVFRPLPLVGPGRAQHSRRLAGHRPRPHRVRGRSGQEFLLDHRHRLGFLGGQPHRPAPHALGAQGQGRGDLTARGRFRRPPAPARAPPRRRPREPTPWSPPRRCARPPRCPARRSDRRRRRRAGARARWCRPVRPPTRPGRGRAARGPPAASPSALAISRMLCAKVTSSSGSYPLGEMLRPPTGRAAVQRGRYAIPGEQVVDECSVFLGQQLAGLLARRSPLARHPRIWAATTGRPRRACPRSAPRSRSARFAAARGCARRPRESRTRRRWSPRRRRRGSG